MRFGPVFLASLLAVAIVFPAAGYASVDDGSVLPPPPSLEQIKAVKKQKRPEQAEQGNGMPLQIRNDAMREAALSYGARGGLAWRTYFIRQEMETRSRYMDKVFDFRQLLIPAPSGLLIEPPVITEAVDAMLIESGGQAAAVADRIYNIGRNARIVSTARTWRAYLERQWGNITPPPDILLPISDYELEIWQENIDKGWDAGVSQADEIFQADLNKLASDYNGMVRYRTLLAQGMVSPPYALQTDRGVTGGGNEMRVGDRSVAITGLPQLQTGTQGWQPANR